MRARLAKLLSILPGLLLFLAIMAITLGPWGIGVLWLVGVL